MPLLGGLPEEVTLGEIRYDRETNTGREMHPHSKVSKVKDPIKLRASYSLFCQEISCKMKTMDNRLLIWGDPGIKHKDGKRWEGKK